MKRIQTLVTIVSIVVVGTVIAWSCTENPFGDDKIVSAGNSQIKGSVGVGSNLSPREIYVWLEGFNLGVRTDQNGDFQINLPSPSSQGVPGGIDGAFNLYYYIANYKLATSLVLTRNGEFLYSQGDINKDGELNEKPKQLFPALRIITDVRPSTVPEDSEAVIVIGVNLVALENDSVTVFFPRSVRNLFGPFLLKRIETNEVFVLESEKSEKAEVDLGDKDILSIDTVPNTRTLAYVLNPGSLQPGEYEIIPYLLVVNDMVPPGLIESLGDGVEELGQNYLQIPFRREGGRLEIIASDSSNES